MQTIYYAPLILEESYSVSYSRGLNVGRIYSAQAFGTGTLLLYQLPGGGFSTKIVSDSYAVVSAIIQNYAAGQKVAMPYTSVQLPNNNAPTTSGTIMQDISDIVYIDIAQSGGYAVVTVYDTEQRIYTLSVSQAAFIASCNALAQSYTTQDVIPLTGNNVVSNGAAVLALNPGGTLATLTITFPSNPINGQPFSISSTQIITLMTFAGGTVQGYTGPVMFNPGVEHFMYDAAQSKWLLF